MKSYAISDHERQNNWQFEAIVNEKDLRGRLLETEWDARK